MGLADIALQVADGNLGTSKPANIIDFIESDWGLRTKLYPVQKVILKAHYGIPLNDTEKRWVLKNPSHLFALDALLATYPDALVIQCHRPPETIMASMCSLSEHTTAGWSNSFVGATIGADALETWSRGLERFNTVRAQHNPAQFCDVDYVELIRDPLSCVDGIYTHFGIEMTGTARASIQQIDEESKQGPRAPKHRYALADYGLTEEQVKERFRGL